MRTFEEVGRFSDFDDRANEAYRTYASLYLDFIDDNIRHFTVRNIDVAPLDKYPDTPGNEEVVNAYLSYAVNIAKTELSNGYWSSFEEMYNEYPMLKERSSELEATIYDPEYDIVEKAVSVSKRCFDLQDWLLGSSTGGIEPPRNVLDIQASAQDDGTVKVTISWDLPKTCGLMDNPYTVIDPDRVRTSVFTLNGSVLTTGTEDSVELFVNECCGDDYEEDAINEFYRKTGLIRLESECKREDGSVKYVGHKN